MSKKIFPLVLSLLLAGVLLASGAPLLQAAGQNAAEEPPTWKLYLPLVGLNFQTENLELTTAWVGRTAETASQAFLPAEAVYFVAELENSYFQTQTLALDWQLDGPCGDRVFTATLALTATHWQQVFTDTLPACEGVFTNTVSLVHQQITTTLVTHFVINQPSQTVIAANQGFDRCRLPSVAQMQAWWQSSPYHTFNVYLGGISFYCSSNPLDAFWLRQVAAQGWSFILTWVGPQAPCTTFKYPMSWDPIIARQQGRKEANAAVATANALGLLGDKTIYYDLESYSGASDACRAAAASFLEGWAERLHELNVRAGAYGAPCTSYITDWAENTPPPDNIWIAHWYTNIYDPKATVWGAPCLPDSMWSNHQRLKQYTGSHYETWGGVTLGIDSDVLDGHVTLLPVSGAASANRDPALVSTTPPIQAFDLLSPEFGWLLQGDRLLLSGDGGLSWADRSPAQASHPLAVEFANARAGWLIHQTAAGLELLHTRDGGLTWQTLPLPAFEVEIAGAWLEFVDAQTGWLALRLPSSSSFSRGLLFATQDGGQTWRERTLPLGEAVHFNDAQHGWVAGGPDGEQFFRSDDGGLTWYATTEGIAGPSAASQGALPGNLLATDFGDDQSGWALTQAGACLGAKAPTGQSLPAGADPLRCWQQTRLWLTHDGGANWREITP